mmetsp:Transcript_18152/g.37477  ORF Transcript_18152/g.37477 Transcript_18152/m.37477 type:complete len:206 (+) Transcript_18152:147-764(+)
MPYSYVHTMSTYVSLGTPKQCAFFACHSVADLFVLCSSSFLKISRFCASVRAFVGSLLHLVFWDVDLVPFVQEGLGHFIHALSERVLVLQSMLGRILPDLLRDLHAAEFGAAHAAEVGDLGRLLGQRLVMEGPRRHRVQRKVELVVPPEVEARMGQLVVPHLSHGVLLRQVCSVGRNLVPADERASAQNAKDEQVKSTMMPKERS